MTAAKLRWKSVALFCATCLALFLSSAARADEAAVQQFAQLGARFHELYAAGEYQQALAAAQQLVKIADKNDLESYTAAISCLSIAYLQVEQYDQAEPWMLHCIKLLSEAPGDHQTDIADMLQNLAIVYRCQHRCREGHDAIRRCLEINLRERGPQHRYVANALDESALLHLAEGKYADAEPLLRRALAIYNQLEEADWGGVWRVHNNLGLVYDAQYRFPEAEQAYRQALDIVEKLYGPDHPQIAGALINLSSALRSQKRLPEAREYILRGLAIREKAYGGDSPFVADILNNAGGIEKDLGNIDVAERLFRRSLAIFERTLGVDHPRATSPQQNLAVLYFRQGRYQEAEPLIEQVVKAVENGNVSDQDRATAIGLRGEIRWWLGRQEEGLADLERSIELVERQRALVSGGEFAQGRFLSESTYVYGQLIHYLIERGESAQALRVMERARSRSLLDQLKLQGADLLAGVPADFAADLRTRDEKARQAIAQIENSLRGAPDDPAQVKNLVNQLETARGELVEVARSIRDVSPTFRRAAAEPEQSIPVAELQSWLAPRNALFVEYFFGSNVGYVCWVSHQGEPRCAQLTLNDDAAKAVGAAPGPLTTTRLELLLAVDGRSLADSLSRPKIAPETFDRLALLWHVLIPSELASELTGGQHSHAFIVPDGPLALLPLEILIVEPGGSGAEPKYLLDVGPAIAYAPSATLLTRLDAAAANPAAPQAAPVLTVGDPAYGAAAPSSRQRAALVGQLSRLPYSGQESRWVRDVFAKQGWQSTQLLGASASEARIRAALAGSKIAHLACHGFAAADYGNYFGALAVAPGPAADPLDDGFLSLHEIYQLDLKQCELAILSACHSNFGPQQSGEGVWSVGRGFLVAGAHRVVASSWLVDDQAAAALVSYYAASLAKPLGAGEPPDYAQALADAKRWVRRQSKWQSPYFWGAFELIGPN